MKSVSVPTHLNTEVLPILGMMVIIVGVNFVLKGVGHFVWNNFVNEIFLVVLQVFDVKPKHP